MNRPAIVWSGKTVISAGDSWATIRSGGQTLLAARGPEQLRQLQGELRSLLSGSHATSLLATTKAATTASLEYVGLKADGPVVFVPRTQIHDLACWLTHLTGEEGPRPAGLELAIFREQLTVTGVFDGLALELNGRGMSLWPDRITHLRELLLYLCKAGGLPWNAPIPHCTFPHNCMIDLGRGALIFTQSSDPDRRGMLHQGTAGGGAAGPTLTRAGLAILADRLTPYLEAA